MASAMACVSIMNMKELERRSVIKFHTKERKKPKEIPERMNAVYGDVFKWGREESIEDDSRSGRPVEASSMEICRKVEDMILKDRRVRISVIAHGLGISVGTVSTIIFAVFMLSKVNSRWVSRMLTIEQNPCRQQFSEEDLDVLRANPEKSSQELLQGMKHASIMMIQRPNKSSCNGNTRGPCS